MLTLRALAIYIATVFAGGALIAPWVYRLGQSLGSIVPILTTVPFHRFVNRSLLGLALIGLWPLLRSTGATSLRDLGLVPPAREWTKLGWGFALGFASLAVLAVMALAAGTRMIVPDLGQSGQKVLEATLAAVVVAMIEEVLFRGMLFGMLKKSMHWMAALLVSSMIYAVVHFLQTAKFNGPITWSSGFEILPWMLRGFGNWHEIIPGFLNLTVAGLLLGMAFERTGNLYFSIGMHAGWVFWLKSYGFLTRETTGVNQWLWGTSKMFNGWIALPVLAVALSLLIYLVPGERKACQT